MTIQSYEEFILPLNLEIVQRRPKERCHCPLSVFCKRCCRHPRSLPQGSNKSTKATYIVQLEISQINCLIATRSTNLHIIRKLFVIQGTAAHPTTTYPTNIEETRSRSNLPHSYTTNHNNAHNHHPIHPPPPLHSRHNNTTNPLRTRSPRRKTKRSRRRRSRCRYIRCCHTSSYRHHSRESYRSWWNNDYCMGCFHADFQCYARDLGVSDTVGGFYWVGVD